MFLHLFLITGFMTSTNSTALTTHNPPEPPPLPQHSSPKTTLPAKSQTPHWKGQTEPLFPQQWNLSQIQTEQAWALAQKELAKSPKHFHPVTIAVLDTGFVNSPELAGRVINGHDFVSNIQTSGDGNGRDQDATAQGDVAYHSEVIANIIAASNNGKGMAGINPTAKILHVRVADTKGEVQVQDLIDGMRWAAGLSVKGAPKNPNPAKILNLSLYADFIPLTHCDPRVQKTVTTLYQKGVLIITGAANDDANARGYSPAGCHHVITVTAVNTKNARSSYANWGNTVHLAAPGGDANKPLITASQHNDAQIHGYPIRRDQGTSFAAPHVTGAASLILSFRPKLHPILVKSLLTRTSKPFPKGQCDPQPSKTCGTGILNIHKALTKALNSHLGK